MAEENRDDNFVRTDQFDQLMALIWRSVDSTNAAMERLIAAGDEVMRWRVYAFWLEARLRTGEKTPEILIEERRERLGIKTLDAPSIK